MFSEKLTPQQALPKLKKYCAYQERCHREVQEKLYSYGIYKNDAQEIISRLIDEGYLNEERFALQYASGKFRIKKWGKVKIKYQLKQKGVSEYCIKKALLSIDKADYKKVFYKLADAKLATLKSEKNIFIKKRKLQDFLLQKGFEIDLIKEIANSI
jgi:regulatory protein